jgi:hypothetical protein
MIPLSEKTFGKRDKPQKAPGAFYRFRNLGSGGPCPTLN